MASLTWWLYLLECLDGSHYLGISHDVPLRVARHLVGLGGRYTRSRGVAALIGAVECGADRRLAMREERRLKRRGLERKIEFFRARDRLAELVIPGWRFQPDAGSGARWMPTEGALAEFIARLDRAERDDHESNWSTDEGMDVFAVLP